jgi:hypothetical protein
MASRTDLLRGDRLKRGPGPMTSDALFDRPWNQDEDLGCAIPQPPRVSSDSVAL